MDMSKAFDSINHDILLSKLRSLGVSQSALEWFSSYIKGRYQHVFDKETLLLIINSFVFSRLFYCSLVWSNTSVTNIHKLQLVQNFAARIILGLRKYDHISLGL